MNAHLFLFGPTGSGKSATLNNLLNQVTAIYRPRLFIVEAGNSFGLFSDFARRLGLTVNRVKLAPGSGISLAPFADARRLIETPSDVQTLDADALDEDLPRCLGHGSGRAARRAGRTGDHSAADDHGRRRQGRSADDAGRPLADPPVHPRRRRTLRGRKAHRAHARRAQRAARPWPGPDAARDAARAAAGDGGRDGHVLPRHGRRDVRP